METRVLIPPSLSLVNSAPSTQKQSHGSRKSKSPKRKSWKSGENYIKSRSPSSTGQLETSNSEDENFDIVDKTSKPIGLSDRQVDIQGSSEEETETEVLKSSSSDSDDIESITGRNNKSFRVGKHSGDLKDRRGSLDFSSPRLCAKDFIDKGTVFGPNDGDIRIIFLHSVPTVPAENIRFIFGCFDRITGDPLDEKKEIRLCNWIRFLKLGDSKPGVTQDDPDMTNPHNKSRVNVIARFVDGKPQFEFTEKVVPGTEIVAFFDIDSITSTQSPNLSINRSKPSQADLLTDTRHQLNHFQTFIKIKTEVVDVESPDSDSPLDLSKSPSAGPKSKVSSFNIKTEPPFESPDSQKRYPYMESISKSQMFSISNVLQSAKIFQPYSLTSPPISKAQNPIFSPNPLTHTSSPNAISFHTNNLTVNSSLATPTSITSSSSSDSAGRNSSPLHPQLQASPSVLIRPILRTRGRERSLLPCEVCGKAFDRPSLLKRHMRTHTGEKPHICDVCSKGFSTSSSLNTHRRIHSGEKPHQCPICGKRFTASSNLYYHRMTHNKEKPHKCILCGKSFPTPGDLKSHQYVHSGSWPYNCPICHRGFSKQTNLRNHLLLHSGDKPHNCHICHKKFALACNLRAHLRTHEEEPISSCISCKRSFLNSLNMLVNGYCRSCLLTNSGNKAPPAETRIGTNSSSRKSSTPPPVPVTLPSLTVPTTLTSMPGFHLPGPPPGTSANPIFPGGSLSTGTNPFLEQLFEWNYRFAKETAGNLSIMQQKLLESQMLAAQLMIGSSNPPAFGMGISDLLRLRPQDFNGMDLNKFIQQ